MPTPEATVCPPDALNLDSAGRQPFRLGPFLVGADGLLRPADPGAPAGFSVRWRGCLVRASLEGAQAGPRAAMAIETAVGRVPSTGASTHALREQAFGLVRMLPAHLPPSWRVRLLADHRIGVRTRVALDMPVAASELVAGVAVFLLGLGPYFDLLREAGAGFAASSAVGAGTAKTCPG